MAPFFSLVKHFLTLVITFLELPDLDLFYKPLFCGVLSSVVFICLLMFGDFVLFFF